MAWKLNWLRKRYKIVAPGLAKKSFFVFSCDKSSSMKKIIGPIFLVVLFACKSSKTESEIEKWEAQAAAVEIIRDDFGVPHIYGKTD